MFFPKQILENEFRGPASAGISEGGRFGRFVLNALVWWTSFEGLHISLGRILISSEILENPRCDPASAGNFEGCQIWEIRFKRTCSLGFLWGPT